MIFEDMDGEDVDIRRIPGSHPIWWFIIKSGHEFLKPNFCNFGVILSDLAFWSDLIVTACDRSTHMPSFY